MIALPLLLLTLATAGDTLRSADSSTYASSELRALIGEAAELNRRVPTGLGGYRAHLESEISIGNRRSLGMEMAVSVEQVASTLTWVRSGEYEQVVKGYRSQTIGVSFASIGFFTSGWAIPSLYGNRLALLFGRDTSEVQRRRRNRRGGNPVYAVHPLADDREQFYRFSGGDTILTMRTGDRDIPIVRVLVTLRDDVPAQSVVFLGEIDLDANRRHIVRLRGYFAVVGGPKPKFDILKQAGLQGIAYVEAVNAESEGQFWLPSHQRFEAQATSNMVGDGRAVFRIVTRFIDRELLPVPQNVTAGGPDDTLSIHPFRLVISHPDTVSAYSEWTTELGTMTAAVSADDFEDVAPDRWSRRGRSLFTVETERFSDVFRLNRIEGVFTGVGGVLRFRDSAPGITLRAAGGWAWHERTARGRAVFEYSRGGNLWAVRAQRSLDITNDFRNPFDSGSTTGAIFARDNYDYIDRRSVSAQWLRQFGARQAVQLRIESAVVVDRAADVHLLRNPLGFGQDYRVNRAIEEGRYFRSGVVLEYRPDVSLEFLRPGLGARLSYERGDGELTYHRIEGRLTARANRGPFSLGARLDAGVVNDFAPPQQFFELGRNQNLPGYDYKEFGGDQAAVFRALGIWRLPYQGAPIHLTRRFWLPSPAPSIGIGFQSGWARATNSNALATTVALGSLPTGHPRSSVSLTLRFFGSAVGLGVAKAIDHAGPVRWIAEFGQRP